MNDEFYYNNNRHYKFVFVTTCEKMRNDEEKTCQ